MSALLELTSRMSGCAEMNRLLREIDFGEPDANAEYFISLRSSVEPMYMRAWSPPEINKFEAFQTGQKFIITGHKGTGKTAILRRIEAQAQSNGYKTEFIVFKSEIIREAELLSVDHTNFNGSIIDEEKIKHSKFYYHAMKRVMISLLISKLQSAAIPDNVPDKNLLEKLFGKNGKDAIRIAFDTILNIAESAEVDIKKLSKGLLKIEPGQLLKKANDDLLSYAIRIAKNDKSRIRLFFDEMHFAFRDKESLRSDAALVRDTVLVSQILNERFAEEGLDIVIYLALRREFLEQPEIAQADIVHVVESYGEAVSWEHHPFAKNHPIFDFITLRFKASLGQNFSKTDMINTYLKDIDILEILDYTWSKPRDIVRFFKSAQSINGNTVLINDSMFRTVLRKYCTQAWQEVKSSLAAFVPIDAIPILEENLKKVIPGQFDGSLRLNEAIFKKAVKPAFEKSKVAGVKYDIDEFMRVLYIMGIYFYRYTDSNGRVIYQQYHRGNIHPQKSGEIRIHLAIAKALS